MASDGEVEVRDKGGSVRRLRYEVFYRYLTRKMLTESQLQRHHYPRPHPTVPRRARLFNLPHPFVCVITTPLERSCRFCSMRYVVDDAGVEVGSNCCKYHPYQRPGLDGKHRCCGRPRDSPPCQTRTFHVTNDIDLDNLVGFMTAEDFTGPPGRVYALDCEFVHTNNGKELAAITIIDHNEKVVMDEMVHTQTPIIDYLPQFSSLSPENFKENCLSIADYRKKICEIFSPDSILLGHSLCNDLIHMKVIADRVVDTAVLYLPPTGKKKMPSLSGLAEDLLGPVNVPEDASKSFKDAVATLRLVKLAACRNM